jgi:hypothetical protein
MSLWDKIRAALSGGVRAVAKRKRAPRIHLMPMHNVTFRRKDRDGSKAVKVSNVSAAGIGFIRSSAQSWPAQGAMIEGMLSIGGREMPIQAKVMRITPEVVGCAIDTAKYDLDDLLAHHFDRELSALEMKEADPIPLRGAPAGKVRRLVGARNGAAMPSGPT